MATSVVSDFALSQEQQLTTVHGQDATEIVLEHGREGEAPTCTH